MPTIFRANTGKCVHVTKQRITCGGQCGEWIYSVQSRDIRERHGAFSDFSIVTYGSLAIMTVVGSFFKIILGKSQTIRGVRFFFFQYYFFMSHWVQINIDNEL